ncbi:cache domain-containing protein [Nitrososphaera viennensis]|uniref:Cache domain-containing protein n=1 Tax=Nitrososphaera viennensis TaxID=1034015 RepID=A0A977IEL8_9ARCH|nr:cache domain-containing protein [Nitrososphaera viennensis]UVS69360.1 cache domain-containing protein [Nitrososphaera viennensis]
MSSKSRNLAAYSIAVALAIIILAAAGTASISALEQKIMEKEASDIRTLAIATEGKLSTVASLMEATGGLPQVAGAPHASQITTELHGVPENVDAEKRQVAQSILSKSQDIEAIAFILPDGEMYIEEPFYRQMNLTRTNFAFRDYFQGAVNSGSTYLGEVYISASSGASASAVAVPIASGGELKGLWIGLVHLQNLDRFAKDMFEGDDGRRFTYADQHGHEVVYSNEIVSALEGAGKPLADMDVYKKAISGESGVAVESIGGKEMLVAYHPVRAPGTTWAVFSIQPYESIIKPVQDLRTQVYSAIAIAAAVGVALAIVVVAKKS